MRPARGGRGERKDAERQEEEEEEEEEEHHGVSGAEKDAEEALVSQVEQTMKRKRESFPVFFPPVFIKLSSNHLFTHPKKKNQAQELSLAWNY